MSALDRLVALVPPPATPVDATGDWPDVALPADYCDLVTRYGNGVFNDHVVLLVPFGECTLLGHGVDQLDVDRELRAELLPAVPSGAWFDQPRELKQVYLRLTEGPHPYETRLAILRDTLAPTKDRGGVLLDDGTRQDHFATETWRVTYETAYGHQIRLSYPPAEEAQAQEALCRAVSLMGCATVSATAVDGSTQNGFTQGK